MLFDFGCEDVASISWIFILFAYFIALIEVRRYKLVSEPGYYSCLYSDGIELPSVPLQETCHLATAETVGKGLKSRWYRS